MAFAALLFYVIAMVIRPHEWGDLINEDFTIVRDSLVVCLALFLFHKHKNLSAPQFPLMVAFLVIVFLSVASTGWVGGGINQADIFLRINFIPFMLMSGLTDSRRKQYLLMTLLIASAMIMVWNGHIQFHSEQGLGLMGNYGMDFGGRYRITYLGFLSDPNDLGMYLVMTIPLVMLLKDKAPPIMGAVFWVIIVTILYGVYMTNSRGTLLATMSLLGLWFLEKYGITKSVFAGAVMSPVFLIIISSFRGISAEEDSAQGRLYAWYSGMQMFQSNPLLGVGQGNFLEYHELTAHNSFVLAFAELGLLGCLVWIAILVTTFFTLHNVATKRYLPSSFEASKDQMAIAEKESKIAKALLYSLTAFCIAGFFLSRTYTPHLYLFVGMSAATLGRVRSAFPRLQTAQFFDLGKMAKISFGVTIGGIVLVYFLIRLLG